MQGTSAERGNVTLLPGFRRSGSIKRDEDFS
jgi:hypothetical protein